MHLNNAIYLFHPPAWGLRWPADSGADYDASEVTSWDELHPRNARQDGGRTVVFDKSAFPPSGSQPLRRVNALGQSTCDPVAGADASGRRGRGYA